MSYDTLCRRVIASLPLLAALFAFRPMSSASVVEALDLRNLVADADRIVVGRVVSQDSHFDERGRIVTDVALQVEEAVKGDGAPGSVVTVRHLGGVVDGVGMRVHGEPSFKRGESVLLFGEQHPNRAVLRTVGMAQGAVRIFERAGTRWAKSATFGLSAVRRLPDGTLQKSAAALDAPRKLDDILVEIRQLMTSAR